jgi:hypothetical protein
MSVLGGGELEILDSIDVYEVAVGAAVAVTGVLVGVESTSWGLLRPVAARLEASSQIRLHQGMLRTQGRVNAVLMPLAAALLVLATATAPHNWMRGLCAAAAVAASLVVVASLTLIFPINRQTESWDPDSPPPGWQALRRRWYRFQGFRMLLLVVAFVPLVIVVSPD